MNNVQMCWSLCADCVHFFSQRRSGAVLMESRYEEGQTDRGCIREKRVAPSAVLLFMLTYRRFLFKAGKKINGEEHEAAADILSLNCSCTSN